MIEIIRKMLPQNLIFSHNYQKNSNSNKTKAAIKDNQKANMNNCSSNYKLKNMESLYRKFAIKCSFIKITNMMKG